MSIDFNAEINLNNQYKSNMVDSKKKTHMVKTEDTKETKDSAYYVNKIKKNVPGTEVIVKSMTSSDVKNYYDKWKSEPTSLSNLSHQITVSPRVLAKMAKDPEYASSMMTKIQSAATPQGFEGAQLLEYKVFVKDDGEIEVMACADWQNQNQNKVSGDENEEERKKKAKRKLEQLQYSAYSFNSEKLNPISQDTFNKNSISYDNYLYQNALMLRFKKDLL